MRAQPSRSSQTPSGSPASTCVTCSASSRGSARTGVSERTLWQSNICSLTLPAMQLRLDAADRLVELVEERRGPVGAEQAARQLFALRQAPVALARTLLADVVESDARLAWRGDSVALAAPAGDCLL